ncbi:hypothetical protein DFH07DRAFT_284352 [Mycena maculata]|uniref:Uncharacterized protein n=1 Tax=Mycena maculata TaxID=230809 RepID=A0AAD7HLW4_9AGAR|nr:hypothetical protein DFH07DRAFT_284352 [Mycena maculata]
MSKFNGEAGAALVFLILYLAVFVWMLFAYLTRRFKWRSRWSLLMFHVTIRLASQGSGIGFAILTFSNTNLFLAFLILGAEGYFSLVLCTFRFVVSWHQHNLPSGKSWLEPRRGTHSDLDRRARIRRVLAFLFLGPFALFFYKDNTMAAFHIVLILANSTIIVGGSYLAHADLGNLELPDTQMRIRIARYTRTAGQSVFLACTVFLLGILLATARNDRRAHKGKLHPTLVVLLIAWIPLVIRGVFGVLQSADFSLSYYDPNNYGPSGFTPHFTVIEYLLGVIMEWLACMLLNMTYFTSMNDPAKGQATTVEAQNIELEERRQLEEK